MYQDEVEITMNDLRALMLDQLRKLKKWMMAEKKDAKRKLFINREPLGTVTAPILNIGSCNALKNGENKERPRIHQIVLVYDNYHDEIYSGIIRSLKVIPKKKSELKEGEPPTEFIFGIQMLSKHEANLSIRQHIDTIISEDSFVFTATPGEIKHIYGIPVDGLILGVCSHNGDMITTDEGKLYYKLDTELLKTHLYIGGLTGQGKTILLKNIIYQLATREKGPSINSIVFDLQGDLVQVMEAMRAELIPDKFKHLYEELELKFQGVGGLFDAGDVLFLKPFYVKAKGFLKKFPWRNFGFRSYRVKTGEELANFLPGLTSKGRATLVALYSLFMERLQSFHFETFYQWLLKSREETKKGYKWTLPGTNEYIEAAGATGDAMIREISKFRTLNVFDTVEEIDTLDMLEKKLVFIYFPNIEGYSVLRSIFLMTILKDIYEKKVTDYDEIEASTNNLIVIDEAHELLPSRSRISHLSSEFYTFIEKEFHKIAKEGRKYGISLVVATQLVSELNEVVEQNAQTKIFFELSPRDVKIIKPDKDVKSFLGTLKRGQAIVYSRDNLEISKATEIRVIPPVFLHCEPGKAYHHFKEEIEKSIRKHGKNLELTPPPKLTKPLMKLDGTGDGDDASFSDFLINLELDEREREKLRSALFSPDEEE
ncbi:MAG: ATP-binding protein [Promethearchaeota archaeon]